MRDNAEAQYPLDSPGLERFLVHDLISLKSLSRYVDVMYRVFYHYVKDEAISNDWLRMKTSIRTTISIPAALKARMDAVDEPINWSSIAAQAFELKLAEITTKRGAEDMNDVVIRLRASKQNHGNPMRSRGLEAGRIWARRHAEAAELGRLEEWTDRPRPAISSSCWEDNLDRAAGAALGPDHEIVQAIRGEEIDRAECDLFWETVIGDDNPNRHARQFFLGFVDGAMEVWNMVKDQL
jgi:hypothetical protein